LDVVVAAVDVVATRRASLVEESVFPVGEIVIDVTEVGAHVDARSLVSTGEHRRSECMVFVSR
jgi:hypothetical protein